MSRRLAHGDVIGEYTVDRFVAAGGNGEVYVARDRHDRLVALKVLSQFSPAAAVRFAREVRVLQHLDHPGIVRLFGHGHVEGQPYLVMELLHGETLDQRLDRGPLAPAEAVRIAMQIAAALSHAHARGVIHRDMKPGNVFLLETSPPATKILDFGIAHLGGDRKLTVTGNPIGTWAYMPPEQANGRTDIDPRADIWSFGVVLFEMLTGRVPFQAETAPALLYKILSEAPPSIGSIFPALPPELANLVDSSLERERENRPPTMEAMLAALRAVAQEDSLVALAANNQSARSPERPPAVSLEQRLSVATYVREARNPSLVARAARELGGAAVALGGNAVLAVFGIEAWSGDEPERAVRFALVAAPIARAVGVATGKVVRNGDAVTGAAVDAAVAMVEGREGTWIDANTGTFVRGRYAVESTDDGSARVVRSLRAASVPPVPSTPFVGREVELAMLLEQVESSVQRGRPTASIVVGSPGIGKSRLRSEAAAAVTRRFEQATVLLARGEITRRDSPFAALRDAMADVIDPSVAAWFDPGDPRERDPLARIDRAHAALEMTLLGLTARGPVVLVLDDAQWLDSATRDAVQWYLEHAADVPVALWIFTRPEGRDGLQGLAARATVLELGPLPTRATDVLVRTMVADAPPRLIERAAGNPLFLEELARVHLEERRRGVTTPELPLTIEAAVQAQLDQLPPPERDFAKRAAVFGPTFWLEAVIALGGEPDAVGGLRRADLVAPRRSSHIAGAKEFAFRNPFCQEVCYGLWIEDARPALHREAAAWLEARKDAGPAEIARQWEAGAEPERSAAAYVSAAESNAMFGDVATARGHLARAFALSRDPHTRWRALVAQDEALLMTTDRQAQRAGLAELSAAAQVLGDRERAEAAWRRSYFHRSMDEHEQARAAGEELASLADALSDERLIIAAEIELAYLYVAEGRRDDAMARAASAARRAERLDDAWWTGRAHAAAGFVSTETADTLGAIEPFERAALAFARAGDRRREAIVKMNLATVLLDVGRVDDAVVRFRESIEHARAVGNARTAAVAEHNLGIALRVAGQSSEAREIQTRAVSEARAAAHDRLLCAALTELAYLALGDSSPEVRRSVAIELTTVADRLRAPPIVASARSAVLRALTASGEDARAALAQCRATLDGLPVGVLRVELSAAIAAATGTPDDLAMVKTDAEAWVAALHGEDEVSVRRALVQRYAMTAAVKAIVAPTPR